jgi:two-component system, cell cycle response regulator
MHALIVDDDPICRTILRQHLIGAGHEVREAVNGRIAWEMLQEKPPGLVITDWMMPEMEGLELVRSIRSAGFGRYIYVILLTAQNLKAAIVQGLESGADDYLVKPFDSAELNARVQIGERILRLETRLTEAREAMERLAMRDSLTNLLNRRAIRDRAVAALSRAERERHGVGFVMVDIDHFKEVNDRYGHLTGDQALRVFAHCLQRSLRTEDHAGRWGGEEFLVVLENAGDSEASEVAERLRKRLTSTSVPLPNGDDLHLTISAGVSATRGRAAQDLEMLIQEADEALYRAKADGRNRVCVFGDNARAGRAASVQAVHRNTIALP